MANPRLKQQYEKEIKSELMKELGITNPMAVPTLSKIIINAGIGSAYAKNTAVVEEFSQDIATITGQKPVVTKSRKAVANFKLREGIDNGIMVTLRQDRMWDFYDKLVNIVLPRVRDFRGVSATAFDGRGNYSLGIREHTVFPELETDEVVKPRHMQVVIVTTATDNESGKALLTKLGMPFKK